MSIHFNTQGHNAVATLSNGPSETQWRLTTAWVLRPAAYGLGTTNTIAHLRSSDGAISNRFHGDSTLLFNFVAANGGAFFSSSGGPQIPNDAWAHVALLIGPNDGNTNAIRKAYLNGSSSGAFADIAPSTVASRVASSIILGMTNGATDQRWRGYVAEVAVWTPSSQANADAIVAECLTKKPSAVTAASPVWYAPLLDSNAVSVGGSAMTVTGATFDAGTHPSLSGGVASETIALSPDPASVVTGSTTQITITRSAAAPAGGGVTYNLTSSAPAVATVPATVNMAEGQTTVTFNVTGISVGSSTITATNAADSAETDALTANVVALRKLKLLAHIDALGATAVKGAVFAAPAGGALVGAKIGEFTGKAFGAVSEGGQAPLEVPVADFGGEALTTADTPVCVWECTSSATSALGNAVPIGSVGPHECTVTEA